MTDDRLYKEAVEWALPSVRNAVLKKPGKVAANHAAALMPQNESRCEILAFELTIDAHLARAAGHGFDYDVLKALVSECLRADRQMPANLADFATDAWAGTRPRPNPGRGRPPGPAGDYDRLALGLLVLRVAKRFSLPKYSSESKYSTKGTPPTAAQAVVDAMGQEEAHVSLATVTDACKKAKKIIGENIR